MKHIKHTIKLLLKRPIFWACIALGLWVTVHTAQSIQTSQQTSTSPSEGISPLIGGATLAYIPPEIGPIRPLDESLEAWLDKLVTYENCPIKGIVDTNGKKSYGAFCYQEGTYLHFVKKYNLMPYAEEGELLNNLSDYSTQRKLTRLIVTNEPNGYKHWLTSTVIRKGLGLPPL